MKVLFSQKVTGISGSERYLLALLPELAKRGLDVSFLMIRGPNYNDEQKLFVRALAEHKIPTDFVITSQPITPSSVLRFRSIVKQQKPDILHTNLLYADVHGAAAKVLMRNSPVFVSVKHGYTERFQTKHGLDPRKVRRDIYSLTSWVAALNADAVVSVSSAVAKFFIESGIVKASKSRVIRHGFDFQDRSVPQSAGSMRFGTPQIVAVSRLVPYKQIDVLVRAMPNLVVDFPDLKLVLVGDGPLRGALCRMASELGVLDHIVFAGFRPNAFDYVRDSDLLALPSAAEGFGLVILEAWWHRKAVICFDVPAPNEIVENAVNGLLVKPFDVDGFSAALHRLLTDTPERLRLGHEGRKTFEARFSMTTMVDRTVALFEELIQAKTAPTGMAS